jgi:hypothetical protein
MRRLMLLILLILASFSLIACSSDSSDILTHKTGQDASQTELSNNLQESISGYFTALLVAENYAANVNIGFYNSDKGNSVLLKKDDPHFTDLLHYLKDCSSGSVTPKITTTVTNGITETIHITVLYSHDRFLDFSLTDGTILRFSVSDEVWFETDDAIYNAKYYGTEFSDFLDTILPGNE